MKFLKDNWVWILIPALIFAVAVIVIVTMSDDQPYQFR